MKELFNRIDMDHSGNLDLQETILFFKSITDDISDENIEKIFNTLDVDGNKSIDFKEFMVGENLQGINVFVFPPQNLFNIISLAGWKKVEDVERHMIKEEEVQALFNMIDTDRTGFLDMKVKDNIFPPQYRAIIGY